MSDTKTVTPPAAGDQEIVTAPTVNTRDQVVRGRGNRITGIVTGTFLALYVTWTLVPFYIMFTSSLKAQGDSFTLPAEGDWGGAASKLLSFQPTLVHYRDLFTEIDFGRYMTNSVMAAVGSAVVSVVFGTTRKNDTLVRECGISPV